MSPGIVRFLKYSTVGASTFVLDLLLLYVFTDLWGIGYVLAAGVAFVIAVSINYFLSRRFVFKQTTRNHQTGYTNFLGIALGGMLLVMGGMYVCVSLLELNYLLSRIAIAAVTGFWNYLLNLFVNFQVAGKH